MSDMAKITGQCILTRGIVNCSMRRGRRGDLLFFSRISFPSTHELEHVPVQHRLIGASAGLVRLRGKRV
jgi:hypothetical protein